MQPHFVCSECGFFSKLSGTCQNESCLKNGERLSRCFCEDNQHFSILKHSKPESEENQPDQEKDIDINDAGKDDYSSKTIDLDDPNLE